MTLCNMVVEAGGKNGVVPADSTTYKYLEVSKTYLLLFFDFMLYLLDFWFHKRAACLYMLHYAFWQ